MSWFMPFMSAKALSHSPWPLSGSRSTPGCWRQKRSGATATKPISATQSERARMAPLMPKISWIITTAPAGPPEGVLFGLAT